MTDPGKLSGPTVGAAATTAATGSTPAEIREVTEADLRSILEDTQDLVIRYDRDIRVLYFNSAADRVYRDFLGISLHVGLRTYDVFSPEHHPYWDQINARILAGETFTSEFELSLPDGRTAIYETAYHPTWKDGEITGFNTFSRDVTAQRRQEQRLRDHQKMESVGLLAGGVAHDFNNLLAAMLGNLNLAQVAVGENDAISRNLDNIQTAIVRASHLTRQLLAYARKAHLQIEPRDLSADVRELIQLLEASVSKKVRIELALDEGLPAIAADGSHLQQIVLNLVTNAADAIGDRPGTVWISTSATVFDAIGLASLMGGSGLEPGQYVGLEVRDDGAGMPAEVVPKIFEPFYTTKGSGRGLGLSATLGILATHRSALQVQSQPDVGTAFCVYFPAAELRVPAKAPLPDAVVEASGTVLVADDDPMVLECTADVLRRIGFHVVVARDGAEALERFRELGTELVLVVLDVAMPRMSGPEALELMRSLRPSIPVVFCSGYADRIDGLQIGAEKRTWFLQKPYLLQKFQQTVSEALAEAE